MTGKMIVVEANCEKLYQRLSCKLMSKILDCVALLMHFIPDCIPVGCVLPTCCPYLPACSAPVGVPASDLGGMVPASGPGGTCLWLGGWRLLPGGGVPASGPGEGTCLWSGRFAPGGCLLPGEGVCSWEVYPSMQWDRPPVNRMTDRCKNITFHQTSFVGGKNLI